MRSDGAFRWPDQKLSERESSKRSSSLSLGLSFSRAVSRSLPVYYDDGAGDVFLVGDVQRQAFLILRHASRLPNLLLTLYICPLVLCIHLSLLGCVLFFSFFI